MCRPCKTTGTSQELLKKTILVFKVAFNVMGNHLSINIGLISKTSTTLSSKIGISIMTNVRDCKKVKLGN